MMRIAILGRAILVEGLIVLPRVVAEGEDGTHVLRLHEAQTADGCETLAAVCDHAIEHRLRADPRACFGVIIETAVDHQR